MLHSQPVAVGEPVLVTGTDLRATYQGPDRPSVVERLREDGEVWQSFQVPPGHLVVMRRPPGYALDWQEWAVTFDPGVGNAAAYVTVTDDPLLVSGPRWME